MGIAVTEGSRQDFTELVDGLPLAVFALDGAGSLSYGNQAFAELLGCSTKEVPGSSWGELLEAHDGPSWPEFTSQLLDGEQLGADFWLVAGNSERRHVRLTCRLGYHDGRVSGVQGVVEAVETKKPSGTARESMFDTELRSREMKVVRRLADGFVIEMKGVLSSVIGLASVLETEFAPESLARQDVEGILAAARTGLELSRNLLGISTESAPCHEPFSPNQLVGKLTALWKRDRKDEVTIEARLGATRHIRGDASQINRLLVNLGVNAIEAMPRGGTLTFATEDLTATESAAANKAFSGLEPGDYVALRVSDTGAGMDDKTLGQAFEPFYTTKPTPVSSGLGLSIVFQTVKQHGGQIRVYSKPGLGTTVTIYLPATEIGDANQDGTHARNEPAAPAHHTILLVDDDPFILKVGQRLLEKLGHTVLTATNGEEAVECYEEHGDGISLVLLDLMMPIMDGAHALERIREIAPHARVVICTAIGYVATDPEFAALGADGLLSKPFTLSGLSATVREHVRSDALDAGAT